MDNNKKIASLEELKKFKSDIFEKGEFSPRKKLFVDFTKPQGAAKPYGAAVSICIEEFEGFENKFGEAPLILSLHTKRAWQTEELSAKVKSIIGEISKLANLSCTRICEGELFGGDSFSFYTCVSLSVKEEFPHILVGAGGFPSPLCDKVHALLNRLSLDRRVPFDFLSYNCRAEKVEQVLNSAYAGRTILDKYGFRDVKNILSSWSYSGDGDKNKKNAFLCAVMASLERAPVDLWAYGDENGTPVDFFESLAFSAYSGVFSLGIDVLSDTAADYVYIQGAKNDDKGSFMVVNFNPYEETPVDCSFDLHGIFGKGCEIFTLDFEFGLLSAHCGEIPESYTILPHAVLVVKIV